tara:strand:+ start:603 stop:1409 length:807 start_codon:yes stop_codon:yes gene_type:complete
MNNGTLKRFEDITDIAEGFSTLTQESLQKISDNMPMVNHGLKTTGKKNTQTTSQLMSLTMLSDSPYRRLRQCLAQIDRKKIAYNEAYFKFKKLSVRVKEWTKQKDEMSLIRVEEANCKLADSKNYIEGALKEIGTYQQAMIEIMETHNIPENWDEADVEKEEIAHHIRMAFRNCHRDLVQDQRMNMGTMEYLEQYGIHPLVARQLVLEYIEINTKLIADGKFPTVDNLYKFLDDMVEQFKNAHKAVMKRIGIKTLMKEEYLFMNKQGG